MRAGGVWSARTRPFLYVPTLLVVGMLLVGTSSASSVLVWRAPFTGSLSSAHRPIVGPCGTYIFGGLHLDRTNGHVTGGATVSSAAGCNPNSSSLADLSATVGLTLPSFSGRSGNYTVLVHWKLDFKADLSIFGSNCQSGTYGIVNIGFGMELDNVSNGSAAGAAGHAFPFQITKIGSANHLISKNITVQFTIALDPSETYEVVPGVSFTLSSDAPAPAPPATSSCGVDASLKAGSSTGLATLVSVAVL